VASSRELDDFERKVLFGWEEISKRGLLTMWLLLAVRDRPRYAAEIATFVSDRTSGAITADDRSVYRALRRLAKAELVVATDRPGTATGADRKYYELTATGARVLDAFIERNVRAMYINANRDLFGPRGS
jgi:DNA-binding PadR family transcriptional regulator